MNHQPNGFHHQFNHRPPFNQSIFNRAPPPRPNRFAPPSNGFSHSHSSFNQPTRFANNRFNTNNFRNPPPSVNNQFTGPPPPNNRFSSPPPPNNRFSRPPPPNNRFTSPPPMNNDRFVRNPSPSNSQFSKPPPSVNNRFSSPPPLNNNQFTHPPPVQPGAQHGAPRPVFTQDNLFNTTSNTNPSAQEGFPFNNSQQPPHSNTHGAAAGRGAGYRGGWRGRGSGRGFNHGNQQTNKKQKKEKVNKRDLPENNTFFCDTCDRGFKTQEKYQEHVDGHIKCRYKDCPFIAAPKLVQLHLALQHRSGMAKKVWSMESEADVQKWREERKRKYPTPENIEKKKEDQAQRVARGEVLETKDFSAMRGGRGRDRGRGRGGRGRGQNRRGRGKGWRNHWEGDDPASVENQSEGSENKKEESEDHDGPPEEVKIDRTPAAVSKDGDSNQKHDSLAVTDAENGGDSDGDSPNNSSLGLLASYGYSSSDGEDEVDEQIDTTEQDTSVAPTLSSSEEKPLSQPSPSKRQRLLPNPFASSSSHPPSSELPSAEQQRPSASPKSTAPQDRNACNQNSSTSPASGDGRVSDGSEKRKSPSKKSAADSKSVKNVKEDNSVTEDHEDNEGETKDEEVDTNHNRNRHKRQKAGNKKQAGKQQTKQGRNELPKYTLLEKLLAPDIRRERNKILQCVHYIVKNKFFDAVPLAKQ